MALTARSLSSSAPRAARGSHPPRRYALLFDKRPEAVGLNPARYGTHSLRRTKVSVIYKRTGNHGAVQIVLGHTRVESTVRYLGVD